MADNRTNSKITVGLAQIAPVYLDRAATMAKVVARVEEAAAAKCSLVAFGEAVVPGYPIWVDRLQGARFNADEVKAMHRRYAEQAVCIEVGDLDPVRDAARSAGMMVVVGIIERPIDRGGHSLYCTAVTIAPDGRVVAVHRKLMPTYEERLTWSIGDGAGLVTHRLGPFTVGALNCWENWMPMARAALYGQGEDLHVAIWPGSVRNTKDITRFIALESRSFVLSVSAPLCGRDIPAATPNRDRLTSGDGEIIHDGGSCIAGPDGRWIVEPEPGGDTLIVAELDHDRVMEERQNFDPSGHYSRPDVLQLAVNRARQQAVRYDD
jgi:nitrilase